MLFCLDFYQEVEILHLKNKNFFLKVLVFWKKAVPLHPLSPKKLGWEWKKKEFFERFT